MSDITKKKMEQIAQMWNSRGKGLITHMALQIEEVSTEGVRVRMPFNPDFHLPIQGLACRHEGPWPCLPCQTERRLTLA